jgi:hypothetical protein
VIPRPEFFVLYNGTDPYPDEQVLRLSDAFEKLRPLGFERDPVELELVVRVININQGRNEGIVKRCRVLEGYSAFIAKVREYEKEGMDREGALKAAVRYCRGHDILKEFLDLHGTEVMNMLITEWNWDDALAVRYSEGMEKGMEKGMERGMERGMEKGIERGMEKGREKSREEIARNALAAGLPPGTISEITGLDITTIKRLAGQ